MDRGDVIDAGTGRLPFPLASSRRSLIKPRDIAVANVSDPFRLLDIEQPEETHAREPPGDPLSALRRLTISLRKIILLAIRVIIE
ncbi:MAG: hypothetical protein U1F59_10845 [Candidatus Competibacteraceae bacterium]